MKKAEFRFMTPESFTFNYNILEKSTYAESGMSSCYLDK